MLGCLVCGDKTYIASAAHELHKNCWKWRLGIGGKSYRIHGTFDSSGSTSV